MTTFILHGGATSKDNDQNEYFFSCFSKFVNKPQVRILLCYFSSKRSEWDKLFKRDKPKIIKNSNKKLSFEIAENAADLLAKIDDCDVLYVAGGQPNLIEPYYPQLDKLTRKLSNKVYIGSSLGTYMVSENYLSSIDNKIHKGIGLLSIQTVCHWDQKEDKEQKLALLNNNSELMVLVLDEYETVEIYKEI